MKRIATWKSLNHNQTLENCRIRKTESGYLIESVINGIIEDFPSYCAYKIRTNEKWETQEFTVYTWIGWEEHTIYMKKDDSGIWERNGQQTTQFSGCIDIDLSVTPFTNTLPINRLPMEPGATKEIMVLFIDVARQTAEPVKQLYTKLSDTSYRFENASGDFVAQITVDEDGLVTYYPPLFRKM